MGWKYNHKKAEFGKGSILGDGERKSKIKKKIAKLQYKIDILRIELDHPSSETSSAKIGFDTK